MNSSSRRPMISVHNEDRAGDSAAGNFTTTVYSDERRAYASSHFLSSARSVRRTIHVQRLILKPRASRCDIAETPATSARPRKSEASHGVKRHVEVNCASLLLGNDMPRDSPSTGCECLRIGIGILRAFPICARAPWSAARRGGMRHQFRSKSNCRSGFVVGEMSLGDAQIAELSEFKGKSK